MAVHVSHAALPYPVANARFSFWVDLYDTTGAPIAPSSPDSEFSLDNGNFADCAEELSSPGTNRGGGTMTFSGAETNGSQIVYYCGSSGANSRILSFFPRVLPTLFTGTAGAGAAGSITFPTTVPRIVGLFNGAIVMTTGGTGGGGTGGANNQARVITGYTAAGVASVTPNWETTPDATTTFSILETADMQGRSLFGACSSYGVTAGGGSTTSQTFPSAEAAALAVGFLVWFPGQAPRTVLTYNAGTRVATFTAFASDPSGLPYFAFPVAPGETTLPIPANITQVNSVTVAGDGSTTPWGP